MASGPAHLKADPSATSLHGLDKAETKDLVGADLEYVFFEKHEKQNWSIHIFPNAGRWSIRLNPIAFGAAVLLIWGFAAWCMAEPEKANADLGDVQLWITFTFSWLIMGAQNLFLIFLVILFASKLGALKLGQPDDVPDFPTASWFMMMFSAGIGIGLFFFGVAEPVNHYEPCYGDPFAGAGSECFGNRYAQLTDNNRAQWAINTTFFHWGLHAWGCYSVVGICLGVMVYRKGFAMTMKSAFYPILKDKIYSWMGDMIDVLSVATTLFGVCTSLGLGVTQLNAGLKRLNPDIGVNDDTQTLIIWVITLMATISVVSGVKMGIRRISEVNFGLGQILMLVMAFQEDTWYLLNSWVQSLGFYFQNFIGLGLHTDAFEMGPAGEPTTPRFRTAPLPSNLAVMPCLTLAQPRLPLSPVLHVSIPHFLVSYAKPALVGVCPMVLFGTPGSLQSWQLLVPPSPLPAQGSGPRLPSHPSAATPLPCDAPPATEPPACCPETVVDGDTSVHFTSVAPDGTSAGRAWYSGWTLFYYAWWVAWCPFVGMFIAKISRGRTIRQVILGSLLGPAMYTFLWFALFGSAGLRMERQAANFGLDCSEDNIMTELAGRQWWRLSCRGSTDMWFDLFSNYPMKKFYWGVSMASLILYFVTSSDSGSLVIDCLTANGNPHPPVLQRIFWSITEGAVANALLKAGGKNGLQALQAVSIIAGLPYTIVVACMCYAIWVTLSEEYDSYHGIARPVKNHWAGALFDALDYPTSSWDAVANRALAIFAPFLFSSRAQAWVSGGGRAVYLAFGAAMFLGWILMLCLNVVQPGLYVIGWLLFLGYVLWMGATRAGVRERRNIDGNLLVDLLVAIVLYPLVAVQMFDEAEAANEDSEMKTSDEDAIASAKAPAIV